jgi:hypothetical protein
MTKRSSPPTDPLHTRCLELCSQLETHAQRLRDYATTPGNAWLAKGELQTASLLLSELDMLLDEIKTSEE